MSAPHSFPSPKASLPARMRGATRRTALIAVAIVFLLLAGAALAYWIVVLQQVESTDNAYVGGHVVQITPQVGGTVQAVNADDTDNVAAGKVLVHLDPADAKVTLDQAEAQLAQAVRETRTLYANNDTLAAQVALRETDLARAREDLQRRQGVAGTGAVSGEEIQHAENAVATAEAALHAAREQLAANQAETAGTTAAQHPNVQRAAGHLREALLAVRRGDILSPVAGQVARRTVQIGQRVAAGAPLMAVVPLDDLWVDANFKESQLARMRIGQPVRLTADVYGSRVRFDGRVLGLGAGTGAAFALLPAQNATGNWIKIVQRVPVRISLDPAQLREHPLRIGLSMLADVDVHDQSGAAVTTAQPGTAPAGAPAAGGNAPADPVEAEASALAARIIQANLGGPAAAAPARPAPAGGAHS